MSVYGKPRTTAVRCTWCRKYGLPCGDRVHKNAIERYVSVAETMHLTITPEQVAAFRRRLEPRGTVAQENPRAAARRARRLSDVAVLVMVLSAAAAVLAIGAVFL